MINVLFACNAGVSTSIIEKKVKEESEARGIDLTVNACSVSRIEDFVNDNDIIVLGPQVKFAHKRIEKEYPNIPSFVISMSDFGLLRADNILDEILSKLEIS